MSTLTIPNSIEAGQPRNASPIKENFDAIATVVNGHIGTTNLEDSAVTSAKLANANVTLEKLATNITTQTWHTIGGVGEPAYENSWVARDTNAGAEYCKDALGFVHLRGGVKSGTVGQAAFTLPAGYRAAKAAVESCTSNPGATVGFGIVNIGTDGTIVPASPSVNTFAYLDGISFYAG